MGNGMNKVLDGLYVGSVRDSRDEDQLKENSITHILSIHDNAVKGDSEGIEYLCIMASDIPRQNLSQFFSQCNDFIHSARINGGNVLIHCLAGVSRSITILVAYLMSVTSLNYRESLRVVKRVRSIANPNLGFQKQLQDFEGRRLRKEQQRLRHKFSGKIFLEKDEEEVKRLISKYHNKKILEEPQKPMTSNS